MMEISTTAQSAVNPLAPENAPDPYPAYARLREAGPLHKVLIRPGLEAWLVTRYQEAREVLCDGRMRVSPDATSEQVREAISAGPPEETFNLAGPHLLSTDPPEHTRLRRIISHALYPKGLASLREPVQAAARSLAREIVRRGGGELMADYAVPLTVTAACELLGVAPEHRPMFVRWGVAMAREELADHATYHQCTEELGGYLIPLAMAKRSQPGDDVLTALAAAMGEGLLSISELIGLMFQLFFAGHETSACLIGVGMVLLLEHPDQLTLLRDKPELISSAVEEILRYDGPSKVPTWRFPAEDVEIAGQRISAGEPVLPLLGCVARDPAQFTDADRFDITSGRTANLVFGAGTHRCAGWAIGKMEAEIGIMTLIEQAPELRLAVPAGQLAWRNKNIMMRAPVELPVTCHERS
jgi:cytochrome P450